MFFHQSFFPYPIFKVHFHSNRISVSDSSPTNKKAANASPQYKANILSNLCLPHERTAPHLTMTVAEFFTLPPGSTASARYSFGMTAFHCLRLRLSASGQVLISHATSISFLCAVNIACPDCLCQCKRFLFLFSIPSDQCYNKPILCFI